MTIQSILKEFADATELPVAAIRESLDSRGVTVPVFLSLLERASDVSQVSEEEERALFAVVHVLAEIGEQRAFRPLLKFLAGDQERVERLLGDAITETLPQILISLFDGDVTLLFDAMNNEDLDEFTRDSAFRAWTYLVIEGTVSRDEAARYLRDCAGSLRPASENHIWMSWLEAIGHLGLEELTPLVRSAYVDQRIPNEYIDWDEFEEMLLQSRDPELLKIEMDIMGLYPFRDTVGRLSNWQVFDDDEPDLDLLDDWADPDIQDLAAETVFNPFRHVGRNDPCPCGSGKKFKKCCLQ